MIKKTVLFFAFLTFILFLTACGKGEIESNMAKQTPDFSFTNQENEAFGSEDLEGKWWIADFIFTNCTTVCLPMTYNMSQLQIMLEDEGIDAELVSFTVDPDVDNPEVLKDYAESYNADLSNWTFLTGYDFETIQELALDPFMTGVKQEPDSDQVTHGVRFFLVSPEGEVIKNYMGTDLEEMEKIVEDLKKVF